MYAVDTYLTPLEFLTHVVINNADGLSFLMTQCVKDSLIVQLQRKNNLWAL